MSRAFHVCLHDATPAYERETRRILCDVAPLIGRRLSVGVVPHWHGAWPLHAHPEYCAFLRESSDDLLLHGCQHRRPRGAGVVTLLTGGSDEMNGLSLADTRTTIARGQEILRDAFGAHARGFLPPAWQRGHVVESKQFEHVLGFFALESAAGQRIPLATFSWDCGRLDWLGHVGHGVGAMLSSLQGRTPVLAMHPRDLERGYWPRIMRLLRGLLGSGAEPVSLRELLRARAC